MPYSLNYIVINYRRVMST